MVRELLRNDQWKCVNRLCSDEQGDLRREPHNVVKT